LTGDDSLPESPVTGQYGDVFTFLTGRLCLDLTTTLQVRHRPDPIETLNRPADVIAWIAQAGLVRQVDVTPTGVEWTRELREVIDRLCRAATTGQTGRAGDLTALNDRAAQPALAPHLLGGKVEYRGDLGQVLSTLARDAIDLLGGPRADRIRVCAHPDCSRLFLDSSHAVRRRWCGMSECGNKSKSASYRRRHKDQESPVERG
jgi:predicted RNA-binding Zn ribbon-like protein